jgi:hypothetical protein
MLWYRVMLFHVAGNYTYCTYPFCEYCQQWRSYGTEQSRSRGQCDGVSGRYQNCHCQLNKGVLCTCHSLMMSLHNYDEKFSPAWWGGGGCSPTRIHFIYHHVKSCSARSSWQGKIPTLFFYSTPICTLWVRHNRYVLLSHTLFPMVFFKIL